MSRELLLSTILLTLNVITLALYGIDKFLAQHDMWRIPEKTLLGFSLLGGGIGGLAGMNLFHHKTRKGAFWVINIAGVIVAIALLVFLGNVKVDFRDFLR